jgi:hypothetical protein
MTWIVHHNKPKMGGTVNGSICASTLRRDAIGSQVIDALHSRLLMKSADCVAGMEHAHCDEVGDDSREGGSDDEEEPAVSLPEFTEAGGLGEANQFPGRSFTP